MGGKVAEMGSEDDWSQDGEDEMDDYEFFEEMEDELEDSMDEGFEPFDEPGPNTREQFEEWEEQEEAPLWEEE